ncbi:ligase-associated DNA damage response endonuclease PdeM [Kovacikia minuta CCNUW1]|uniref:ligase-associated DNA damage response endonuclease PdeM n=1 Tax=Kovacikia minuta TaxID=2931930 RepID=UPI001CCCF451|nr:ligase-associated DNA damage response endonuclease PdeM [Kovacikia minuta]UBF25277.1 ligase-associated DNA damage response endonuclease PdeM [Kovacikia minuta CCNUW1]
MQEIQIFDIKLQLLPEKAIYIESLQSLLVADVHLGKSETFQAKGIPISNQVNQQTLDRLQTLCAQFELKQLLILGDLFHSKFALVDEVLNSWQRFLKTLHADVQLIIGNHDRYLTSSLQSLSIDCTDMIQFERLLLSHEPTPKQNYLNICGHVHPCIRIRTRLDQLRLPCFYFDRDQMLLMLPSFGEFTGGYEVQLKPGSTAYAIADSSIIPFQGSR